MKVRDSGMPHEEMWSEFFDAQFILEQMQLTPELEDVVDLGSGYGTFSIPAAQIVSGTVHAFDIEPEMIDLLESKAGQLHIKNIELHLELLHLAKCHLIVSVFSIILSFILLSIININSYN